MTETLYSKEDNKELTETFKTNFNNKNNEPEAFTNVPIEVLESKISEAHKKVVESGQALSVRLDNDHLFNGIKNIFTNDTDTVKVDKVVYFNQGKNNTGFVIDNTILSPTPAVVLGVIGFERKYLDQIEKMIFNDLEKLNPEHLFTLVYLVDMFEKKMGPLKLVSNRNRRLVPKMTNVLNTFFNKNYNVLKSIYVMFNGLAVEKEKEKTMV